jgi:hypothetical protein
VDGCVKHHSAGNGHDGANVSLSDSVVMMRANASEANDLLKERQTLSKGCRGECSPIVSKELLRDDPMVTTEMFVLFFGM